MAQIPDPDAVLVALAQQLQQQAYQFITVTPLTHQRVLDRPGTGRQATPRAVLGWNVPLVWPPHPEQAAEVSWLSAHFEALAAAGWLHRLPDGRWQSSVRLSSLPVQGRDLLLVHSGYPTQTADAVFFGPDTYRFVRALQGALPPPGQVRRAVELCAGAAPAALTLKHHHPQATVWATDINPKALQLARINSQINGLDLQVLHSDLYAQLEGCFDLIVANPPYLVDAHSRTYRHGGALLGAELAVRIVAEGLSRLNPGGQLLLYTGVAIVAGVDGFWQALQPVLQPWLAQGGQVDYQMLDPDVFGEELAEPAYQQVERIAAVWLQVRAPAGAGCAETPRSEGGFF